ncbi:helix-turn-helix domain-containing protein [Echinicola salinicaeni]|uniref:helix-turn-helix domain-containing protein n=1 Tax=Echinicola salinicaeni TaxID=2762757 RepID=UPI001648CB87|nr:helix-turn-helix domain-containing protein [Echinicola salinicaeni]
MKQLKLLITSFICLIINFHIAYGQNLKFKTYQVEEGLSNNSINQIVNDESGGLWIASWDGLNYFDGSNFKVYKHNAEDSTSISGNFISELLLDSSSNLWLQSSTNAVSLKKGDQFKNFYFNSTVNELGLNQDGTVVVKVQEDYYAYADGKFKVCQNCELKEDTQSRLKQLLLRKYPYVEILDTHTDSKGQVWYATLKHGLFVLPNESASISDLEFDNYKTDLSNPYSLKSNEVCAINEDVFGNIWLGLKDGGISMAFKNSNEVYSVYPHPRDNPELPQETIRAISQDQSGSVWLGFYNSGLFINDNESGQFKSFPLKLSAEDEDWKRIRSLFTDHLGRVWVGTYAGIARVDTDFNVEFFKSENIANFPNDRNYDFFEDKEENCIWIACWGGLAKYDLSTDQFVSFSGQNELNTLNIRQIIKANNALYLATENDGLIIFGEGEIRKVSNNEGLLSNSIYALSEDKGSGNIWVATLGGVSIYDPEKGVIKNIDQYDGLKSQFVYAVLPSEKYMWLSTTNGIARIDKNDFTVRTLAADEGWQGAEFSEGAFYKSDRGMMFFGGVNGLNYFHPNSLDLKDDLPLLSIERPKEQVWESLLSSGTLEVEVLPIAFTKSPQNRLQYKLIPGQGNWTDLGADNRIFIEGLSAGQYSILVRNSLELNPESYISMDFAVPKPIWHYPILWVAALLFLLTMILIWRNNRNKANQALLQRKIEERTQLIREQKAKLEKINRDLDLKNREINHQKEALLALHQRHKDADFEIEKFRNYMLGQFKLPLSELKETLETLRTHSKSGKETVMGLVEQMMNQVKEWDKLTKLDQIDTGGKSLTIAADLMESVVKNMLPQFEQHGISIKENYQLSDQWIEMDVFKFKLFWQYLLREMKKYMEEGAGLEIDAHSSENGINVGLKVSSQLLVHNMDEIEKYSPYWKSSIQLLKSLSGQISHEIKDENLIIKVGIPVQAFNRTPEKLNIKHWKHLNLGEQLDPNKHHVILLGKKYESDSLVKIIHNDDFDIIVEEEVKMVVSAIRNAKIDALIIYNEKISQHIVDLIDAIKVKGGQKIDIPVIYIYDTIEVGFLDKLMDLGVETFIQLPASSRFIMKKIATQLNNLQRYKSERNILSTLPDNEDNAYTSPNEKLVKEGVKIIREQLSNGDFKVETLSDELGISKIKCYRVFKEVLGTSPSDLIISLKLEKAQKLLLKNKMNISEVSFACGFNDPKYFSKLFKRHFGKSPKHFQQPEEVL